MFQQALENASEPHLPPGNMQRLTRTPYDWGVTSSVASKTSAHDSVRYHSYSILKIDTKHIQARQTTQSLLSKLPGLGGGGRAI